MEYRSLGRTGWQVSRVSFGGWAIGGAWGATDDKESMATLNRALDRGINFFDTADVYGDGRSERLLGRLKKERREPFFVATKVGRRIMPPTLAAYSRDNLTAFVERSLQNLGVDALDLVQLHTPPPAAYYRPDVFGVMDDLVRAGKVRFYGVSVEKVEEGLKALDYPGVQSVQIIYNMFRQRPGELFLSQARRRQVGVLARIPLASGLLTGKLTKETKFADDDHRLFNRAGAAFDKGETFAGVPYDVGLAAVDELRPLVPRGTTMAAMALRWVLMSEGVTCAIPGGRKPAQVDENAAAVDLPALHDDVMAKVRDVYDRLIKPHVHNLW
jgi:aryl-alcohol dehydrogenase-like predicted oxidoreductase